MSRKHSYVNRILSNGFVTSTLRMYVQPKPSVVICERVDTFYFNVFISPCQESQGHTSQHLEERASKAEQIFSVLFSAFFDKTCFLYMIVLIIV